MAIPPESSNWILEAIRYAQLVFSATALNIDRVSAISNFISSSVFGVFDSWIPYWGSRNNAASKEIIPNLALPFNFGIILSNA
jgi:hypothetical protein